MKTLLFSLLFILIAYIAHGQCATLTIDTNQKDRIILSINNKTVTPNETNKFTLCEAEYFPTDTIEIGIIYEGKSYHFSILKKEIFNVFDDPNNNWLIAFNPIDFKEYYTYKSCEVFSCVNCSQLYFAASKN